MTAKIVNLFGGDQRCQVVYDALAEVIYERAKNLPLSSTLGILDLLKYGLIQNADHFAGGGKPI